MILLHVRLDAAQYMMKFAVFTFCTVLLRLLSVHYVPLKAGERSLWRFLSISCVMGPCAIMDAVEIQMAGLVLKNLLTVLTVLMNVLIGLTGLIVLGGLISEQAGWKEASLI